MKTTEDVELEPHRADIDSVADAFGTDQSAGLSTADANARLARFGRNELTSEAPPPAWLRLLAQFRDVLVLLLLVATAVSATLWVLEGANGLPYEALAILSVVVLNAVMGYVQEARAEATVAALRRIAAPVARVIRDGEHRSVPSAETVPGDLIVIEEGDSIPADARVIRSTALQTAEAALTGESLPVSKDVDPVEGEAPLGDRHNMVFSGTSVTYGRGIAIVTATGMRTEIGRIAGMLQEGTREVTPLQRELARLGRRLGVVVVIVAAVMIGTILLVQDVGGWAAIGDVLILGVALAVAAVPEGLPAVVTAVLAIGVRRIARHNGIVRHLTAVETLGSATVIASDKTGTLTKNEMTVRTVVTASGRVRFEGTGYAPVGDVRVEDGGELDGNLRVELRRALTVADRATNAALRQHESRWVVHGDPTEGALIVAARKAGLSEEGLADRFARLGEIPFSSERKLMTTVHADSEHAGRVLAFTKGAPDVLVARCSMEFVGDERRPLTEERRRDILRTSEELAGQALRTLGVAGRELSPGSQERDAFDERVEHGLAWLGLIGMIDPPRDEARSAVALAKGAGIRSIMITGDHPRTASVIASELGIGHDGRVMTGAEIERATTEDLSRAVMEVSVYARVNPLHKLRIVKALQSHGETVSMTGDGVNDAPALQAADIGVAMGITGTDVSKEASDIVLTDDNFASIVAAVEQGRAIFANIRKFLRYLLSSNVGEVMTMFGGVMLAPLLGMTVDDGTLVLPLLATQILWINLVTDGLPALALGVDPADPDVMRRPPRPRDEAIVTRAMWAGILSVALIMAGGTLLVLDAAAPGGFIEGSGSTRHAQTMAFNTLMLFQVFNVFNARSNDRSAFHRITSNRWLGGAVGVSLLLQAAVIYLPVLQQAFSTTSLGFADWARCTAVASTVLWLRELSKLPAIFTRRAGRIH